MVTPHTSLASSLYVLPGKSVGLKAREEISCREYRARGVNPRTLATLSRPSNQLRVDISVWFWRETLDAIAKPRRQRFFRRSDDARRKHRVCINFHKFERKFSQPTRYRKSSLIKIYGFVEIIIWK